MLSDSDSDPVQEDPGSTGVPLASSPGARQQAESSWRRSLYIGVGMAAVAVAYLGLLLPGLPTTPWLLLALYCFSRSSKRLEQWLLHLPIMGKMLRDWQEQRGIRLPVKIAALCLVIVALSFTIGFTNLPVWLKIVILAAGGVGIAVILFVVPTIRFTSATTIQDESRVTEKSVVEP